MGKVVVWSRGSYAYVRLGADVFPMWGGMPVTYFELQ